jgi:hypothetical protein
MLVTERSQLVLPRLSTEQFVADAVFVDGSHIFHNVFADLYFLREIIRPAGLIVLDEYECPRWRPRLLWQAPRSQASSGPAVTAALAHVDKRQSQFRRATRSNPCLSSEYAWA